MKMSEDPRTSAQASANDRKIVFLAGTYVTGIPSEAPDAPESFGTSRSPVSAEAAERPEVDLGDQVLDHAHRFGHATSGVNLDLVPLAIPKGQRVGPVSLFAGDRQGRRRVESAAQKDHGFPSHHPPLQYGLDFAADPGEPLVTCLRTTWQRMVT